MARRNPFDDIEELFERMQENFESAARMWDPEDLETGLQRPSGGEMSIDLEDRGEQLVLTADLPGFETEDIDVRVMDRTLRISAERDETTESRGDDGEYFHRERRHTSVSRSISLPVAVDDTDITATYNNGVLTVRMPKVETSSGGTQIDVN